MLLDLKSLNDAVVHECPIEPDLDSSVLAMLFRKVASAKLSRANVASKFCAELRLTEVCKADMLTVWRYARLA
jgi:hypothetical protein